MQRSAKIALIAVVAVIVIGGAGFYWFVLRDTAPPVVTLGDAPAATTGGAPASADGNWKVQQETSPEADSSDYTVFVGYRVMELFAGDTIKKEAVGRTVDVTGTMTIKGQTVPSAEIDATLTSLKSDRSPRDNIIRDLTLHGQTKSVTVPLDTRWNGANIQITGLVPITFSDYNIEKISIPTVSTDDKGSLEIALTFVPA
jgi:hypothetical protein